MPIRFSQKEAVLNGDRCILESVKDEGRRRILGDPVLERELLLQLFVVAAEVVEGTSVRICT